MSRRAGAALTVRELVAEHQLYSFQVNRADAGWGCALMAAGPNGPIIVQVEGPGVSMAVANALRKLAALRKVAGGR